MGQVRLFKKRQEWTEFDQKKKEAFAKRNQLIQLKKYLRKVEKERLSLSKYQRCTGWVEQNTPLVRLKTNARIRGVAFNLSLQEFRQWAKETGYLDNCGRKKKNLTIDRINRDNPLGYHIDNIQVLTNGENARKYYAFEAKGLEYPSQEPEAFDSMDEMKITSDEMAF